MLIEIRAAEGGADADDLVTIQTNVYLKVCVRYSL